MHGRLENLHTPLVSSVHKPKQDYHGASKNAEPLLDPVQNYELLGGFQNQTHTVLQFQRPWDTCDSDHDRRLGNDTERIIWTVHREDPPQQSQMGHGGDWQGARSVHLVSVANPRHSASHPHVKQWDVKLNNFSVPDNMDTLYWCKIFKVPPLTHKHHIIGYEPLISAGSRGVLHHMLLYECVGVQLDQYLSHPGAACDSPAMPRPWEFCVTPSVAWATSSTVTDSSGLRIFYTDKLRQNEGAMFVTGIIVSPLQVIPPWQHTYKTAGYCDFHCTHSTLPSEINVISALLHSHRAGREITLRHIRAGVELPPFAQDKTYDFKYQQSRVSVEEQQILPGDEIITECVYNTASRSAPTVGGYSTKQEMCLGFITYYPRSPLASCLSMTPVDFFFHTFGVQKFYHFNMTTIERMFLRLTDAQIVKKTVSTTPPSFPKLSPDDELNDAINEEAISTLKKMADYSVEGGGENSLFDSLIIEDPEEFRNRSFTSHLHSLPWAEQLLTQRIETAVYRGKHMTFCRLYNDSLQTQPQVFNFPNFTELENSSYNMVCPQRKLQPLISPDNSSYITANFYIIWFSLVVVLNKTYSY
ncbi:DBH-like monooxygenase protein 1 [Homalodisca vitripennis]|nr:DBH-like monooxygenase protein 1 [Homalodisca vitripennis]